MIVKTQVLKLKLGILLVLLSLLHIANSYADSQIDNVHAHEEIGSVEEAYSGQLFPDIQVNTFRNIDRLYPSRVVKHGEHIYPLPISKTPLKSLRFSAEGVDYDLYDFFSLNRVSGLLIIKNGEIKLEEYQLGNTDKTRWMSMSIVKTVVATLVAVAIQDGYIKNIDDPITRYLPEFKNTSYDGVTLRHLLQMTSGVKWNDTYSDPESERRKMLYAQNSLKPGSLLKLLAGQPRMAKPGTKWNYSTGETQLLTALIRTSVGKPVAEYFSERIWAKLGMESDATWWLDARGEAGLEIGGSGLSATLRDYGRLGLFWLNDGKIGKEQVLPKGWIKEAVSPQKFGDGQISQMGYMFWPINVSDGSYIAHGIFGQYLYVNPKENVVIVIWGAQPKALYKETIYAHDFFAAVVKALRK